MRPKMLEEQIGQGTPPTERDITDQRQSARRPQQATATSSRGRSNASLRRMLQSRQTLRQAILLNEILGAPAALRQQNERER